MNLTRIREAVAALLTFGDVTASPRVPGGEEITCPHAFISDMSLRFTAMETVDVDFEVTVLVAQGDPDSGWATISRLCDFGEDTSIIDALLEDRHLGGQVADIIFPSDVVRGLGGAYAVAGIEYMAFQLFFTAQI